MRSTSDSPPASESWSSSDSAVEIRHLHDADYEATVDAMRDFIQHHPQWDQYRLMQVALAGFLFQQGCQERAVVRHYLDGLFDRRHPPLDATPSSPLPR